MNASASSAPAPDGFVGSFNHSCWDIIDFDVARTVREFFVSSEIVNNLN